ncbi:hypothetical protein BDA99DRAFT_579100 [Phascolomyces articulosus]|uniref:Uncharacterized protein n=1 Tax=Phascolomyces articulosus TaxID=60185 RepID=A0AAD5K2Q2_9FUNG|nr:hypothetical protein BDA99DRAFT_579100 [Phascolomyces articulosus]
MSYETKSPKNSPLAKHDSQYLNHTSGLDNITEKAHPEQHLPSLNKLKTDQYHPISWFLLAFVTGNDHSIVTTTTTIRTLALDLFQGINRHAFLYGLEEPNDGSSMATSLEDTVSSSSHIPSPEAHPQHQQPTIKKLQHPIKPKAKHINFSTLSTKHHKKREKNKRNLKET